MFYFKGEHMIYLEKIIFYVAAYYLDFSCFIQIISTGGRFQARIECQG